MKVAAFLCLLVWMLIGLAIEVRLISNALTGRPFLDWTYDGVRHTVYLAGGQK